MGLGVSKITARQVTLSMKIGQLPCKDYLVDIVPIPEHIIGIDILKDMMLYLPEGKYQFAVWAFQIPAVLVEKMHMTPVTLPSPPK